MNTIFRVSIPVTQQQTIELLVRADNVEAAKQKAIAAADNDDLSRHAVIGTDMMVQTRRELGSVFDPSRPVQATKIP